MTMRDAVIGAVGAAVVLACAAGTAAAQPYTVVQWTGYQTTCGDPLPPIAAFTDPDCWAGGVGPVPQQFPFAQLVVLGGNGTPEGAANEIYLGGACADAGAICPAIARSDPLDFHLGSLMVASGDFVIDGGTGVYGDVAGCDTSGRGTITTEHFVLSAFGGPLPFDPERGIGPSSLTLRNTDVTVWGSTFLMGSQDWGPTHVVLDKSSLTWGSFQRRAFAILHDGSTLEARDGSRISFENPSDFNVSSLAGIGDATLRLDDSEFVGDFFFAGGVNLQAKNGSRVQLMFGPVSFARLSGQSISIESGSSVEARDAWLPEDGTLLVEDSMMSFTNDFRTEGTSNVINSTISADSMDLGGLFTADAATTLNTADLEVNGPAILEGNVVATGRVRVDGDDARIDRLQAIGDLDVRGDRVTIHAEHIGGKVMVQGDGFALVDSSVEGDALVSGENVSFMQVEVASDLEIASESFLLEGSRVDGTVRHSGGGIRLRDSVLGKWDLNADVEEVSNVELAASLDLRQTVDLISGEGLSVAGDVSVITDELPVVSVNSFVPWEIDGDLLIRGVFSGNRASVTIESAELRIEGETELAATSLSARGTLRIVDSAMHVGGDICVSGGGGEFNASLIEVRDGSIEPIESIERSGDQVPTLRLGDNSIRRFGRLMLRSGTIGIPVVLGEVGRINGTGILRSLESAGVVELSDRLGPLEVEHSYTALPGARIETRGEFTGISASLVTLAGSLEVAAPGGVGVYLLVESRDADIEGDWSRINLPGAIGDRRSTLRRTPRRIELVVHCQADLTSEGTEPGDALYGQPDSVVSGEDLTFFVEAWLAGDAGLADLTTARAVPGDAGFGVPDGSVTVIDLTYFVEAWLTGCG